MSLRNGLAAILARDPRYTYHAYDFVFEALEYTKNLKKQSKSRGRGRAKAAPRHVTGHDLCEGARRLALEQYGMMALAILKLWGIRSTSDIGEIVYNLIQSGDFEKTSSDERSDFDNVFDFEVAFQREFVLRLDEVA